MIDEQTELSLLDKVAFRIANADSGEQLQSILQKLLVPLLKSLHSTHATCRSKVLQISSHINTRLKASVNIELPLKALLDEYISVVGGGSGGAAVGAAAAADSSAARAPNGAAVAAASLAANVLLMYCKMAWERSKTKQEHAALLLEALANSTQSQCLTLLACFSYALPLRPAPAAAAAAAARLATEARATLLEYALNVLLATRKRKDVAGQSRAHWDQVMCEPRYAAERVADDAVASEARRALALPPPAAGDDDDAFVARKRRWVEFLAEATPSVFTENDVRLHFHVAACSNNHLVQRAGDDALRRLRGATVVAAAPAASAATASSTSVKKQKSDATGNDTTSSVFYARIIALLAPQPNKAATCTSYTAPLSPSSALTAKLFQLLCRAPARAMPPSVVKLALAYMNDYDATQSARSRNEAFQFLLHALHTQSAEQVHTSGQFVLGELKSLAFYEHFSGNDDDDHNGNASNPATLSSLSMEDTLRSALAANGSTAAAAAAASVAGARANPNDFSRMIDNHRNTMQSNERTVRQKHALSAMTILFRRCPQLITNDAFFTLGNAGDNDNASEFTNTPPYTLLQLLKLSGADSVLNQIITVLENHKDKQSVRRWAHRLLKISAHAASDDAYSDIDIRVCARLLPPSDVSSRILLLRALSHSKAAIREEAHVTLFQSGNSGGGGGAANVSELVERLLCDDASEFAFRTRTPEVIIQYLENVYAAQYNVNMHNIDVNSDYVHFAPLSHSGAQAKSESSRVATAEHAKLLTICLAQKSSSKLLLHLLTEYGSQQQALLKEHAHHYVQKAKHTHFTISQDIFCQIVAKIIESLQDEQYVQQLLYSSNATTNNNNGSYNCSVVAAAYTFSFAASFASVLYQRTMLALQEPASSLETKFTAAHVCVILSRYPPTIPHVQLFEQCSVLFKWAYTKDDAAAATESAKNAAAAARGGTSGDNSSATNTSDSTNSTSPWLKVAEKSALALALLATHADSSLQEAALVALFKSSNNRRTDFHLCIGQALSILFYNNKSDGNILEQCISRLHGSISVQRSTLIWLLEIIENADSPKAYALFADQWLTLQRAFASHLGDTNVIIQDIAARGIACVYEKASQSAEASPDSADIRKQLTEELIASLTGASTATPSAKKTDTAAGASTASSGAAGGAAGGGDGDGGDTPLFNENEIGRAPDGGAITTYKEIVKLSTDIGQPDLIYRLLQLSSHNATIRSRGAAARATTQILATNNIELLRPHMKLLLPKLYLQAHDPSDQIAAPFARIMKQLPSVNDYVEPVLAFLVESLTHREWRQREAAASAVADILSGKLWMDVKQHFGELFHTVLRVSDDVKESVRMAALRALKALSALTLRLVDETHASTYEHVDEVSATVLPILLSALSSSFNDVRQFSLSLLPKVCKTAGPVALAPHVATMSTQLLEAFSALEPRELNYMQQHLDRYAISQATFEDARLGMARVGPLQECVDVAVEAVNSDNASAVCGELLRLLKQGVGMTTRVATAHFLNALAQRRDAARFLPPHTGKLLGALVVGLFKDRSPAVRDAFQDTLVALLPLSSDKAQRNVVSRLAAGAGDRTQSTGDERRRDSLRALSIAARRVPRCLRAQIKSAGSATADDGKQSGDDLLAMLFIGAHDEDEKAQEYARDANTELGIQITDIEFNGASILQHIESFVTSQEWKKRAQGMAALADFARRVDNGDGFYANSVHNELMYTICHFALVKSGVRWTGREKCFDAVLWCARRCMSCALEASRASWRALVERVAKDGSKRARLTQSRVALLALKEAMSELLPMLGVESLQSIVSSLILASSAEDDVDDTTDEEGTHAGNAVVRVAPRPARLSATRAAGYTCLGAVCAALCSGDGNNSVDNKSNQYEQLLSSILSHCAQGAAQTVRRKKRRGDADAAASASSQESAAATATKMSIDSTASTKNNMKAASTTDASNDDLENIVKNTWIVRKEALLAGDAALRALAAHIATSDTAIGEDKVRAPIADMLDIGVACVEEQTFDEVRRAALRVVESALPLKGTLGSDAWRAYAAKAVRTLDAAAAASFNAATVVAKKFKDDTT